MVINGKTFEGGPDKTILDVAEANGFRVESHCRNGFCGCCRTSKVSGEAIYVVDPLACFDEEKEIIPCCASSISDVVLLA